MDVGMHVESLIAGNIAENEAMTTRVSDLSNPPVIVLLSCQMCILLLL
jgi:hypothetical protein